MAEESGNKGKWTSHRRNWIIHDQWKGQGVHIDFKKKELFYNRAKYWIRFETEELIHVYGFRMEVRRKK
jgi:hypothetical protein